MCIILAVRTVNMTAHQNGKHDSTIVHYSTDQPIFPAEIEHFPTV